MRSRHLVAVMLAAVAAVVGTPATAAEAVPVTVALELSGEPAREYATGEPVVAGDRAIADELRRRHPGLEFSSNLACAARELGLSWPSSSLADAPHELITFLLHSCGCPDASAYAELVSTTSDTPDTAWERLAETLAGARERYTHAGTARVADPSGRYRWRWVTLLAERRLVLDPLPRRLDAGTTVLLRFALAPGLDDAGLIITAPGGATRRVTARRRDGGWEAALPLAETGEHVVEIVAEDALGPQVLAVFPVSAGVPPPRQWRGEPPPPERQITSVADAERYLRELTDRRRAAHGRPPLAWSETLAAVARAHAEDMRDHGFMGHRSPSSGELADRLASASFRYAYAAENIARSTSLWEAMESLMRSPGHRRNLLSAEATQAGIGVAVETGDDGERTYLVTQVFARPR